MRIIVGYTIFRTTSFKTRYQHFDNLEKARMFCNNKFIKDCSMIYIDLDSYETVYKSLQQKNKEYNELYNKIIEEKYKLNDFINTMKFINNTECYAYKVAKEKFDLLNNIIRF